MSNKRILYVGDLWYGSTALWRLQALQKMNLDVTAIDSTVPAKGWKNFVYRFFYKLKIGLDFNSLSSQISQRFVQKGYDALWVDKGLTLSSSLLKSLKKKYPETKLIFFSPDDMFNPANQTLNYFKCLPFYNAIITTKSTNLVEYKEDGFKNVFYVQKSYEPSIHRPIELSELDKSKFSCEVGFIGNFEKPRFQSILSLAKSGISVSVKGPAWKEYQLINPLLRIDTNSYFGDEYSKVINATKINLGFLHKGNRDQHTARSIEIPACKGFLLAERTYEHLALFKEGQEAEFFGSDEELKEKVVYYLANETKRIAIAEAGYQRCLRDQYDNYHVFKKIVDQLL